MKYISTYYRKLFKFQKKIQETEKKNPRLCRNFQRRLYRSSSIQLLIINEILQLQLKRSRKKKEILYFQKINEIYQSGFTNQSPIRFSKLISKEYRYCLTRQIFNILWVFALSPILDNKKKDQIILTGLKGSKIYPTIYTFLKQPFIQYIAISQFSNFFNRKNKYWILSNLLIEKKFFLNWLKFDQRSTNYAPLFFSLGLKNRNTRNEFTLQNKKDRFCPVERKAEFLIPKKELDPLSLKTTLENFVNLSFSDFLDTLHRESTPTILSRYNTFAQNSYYFLKYQNCQGLHPTIFTSLRDADCRFMDTSRSVVSCPCLCITSCNSSIFARRSLYGSSFAFPRDSSIAPSQSQNRLVNSLKLFVQKLRQDVSIILLPNLHRFTMTPYLWDAASSRSKNRVSPIYKRLQINRQKFSNLKTRLKIKPLLRGGDATKRFAIFHQFNNIDLKNGSRNAVNGITSISQQFSVCKDILPSLFSTSKFLYFDLMQKYGLKPIPIKLALASSPTCIPQSERQCPISFFHKQMEYNGLILLALKKRGDLRLSQNSLIYYAQTHGLKIKFIKFYSLYQGLHFLGWFFHKKNHSFEGFISHKNIYNHQKELKYLLKTSENKPMDKIIYELNQKILRWKKFYNCSIQVSKTCSQFNQKSKLNDDLFWLIWRWMKKRHINRSSKWLYTRYWKKSTSRKWIFFANQHNLIFYI